MVTKRELSREERYRELVEFAALLVKATKEHQGEWHAIVDATLYTGVDRDSVCQQLVAAGKDPLGATIKPVPVSEQTFYHIRSRDSFEEEARGSRRGSNSQL